MEPKIMDNGDIVLDFDTIMKEDENAEVTADKNDKDSSAKTETSKNVETSKNTEINKTTEASKNTETNKKTETKNSEKKTDGASGKKNTDNKKADKEHLVQMDEPIKMDPSKVKNAQKGRKGSGKKGGLIAFLTILSLIVIVYVSGFVYYSMHFYNDITANGVNVSGMNEEAARQTLNNFYKNYELKVSMIDGSEQLIKADDISMQITLKDEFKKAFKLQEPYLWFVNMFEHNDFEIGTETNWNQDALNEMVRKWPEMDSGKMVKPENAYVGVVDGKFSIVKEVMGTTLDKSKVETAINNSLTACVPTVSLLDKDCYSLPTIFEDNEELIAEFNAKNEYAQNEIKLQLDDLVLEPGMELYEAVLEKSGTGYSVNESKVAEYVNELADKYDSYDKDREFTTSWDNRKITTHGSAFGYEMNRDETIAALINAINSKQSKTVEAVFEKKGKSLIGENDIGDTYIEVNLSEQHVYAYKNGKLIADDDCVSGCESAGHGTCIGLYQIQAKLSPTVLRGEKKPVTKTTYKKGKKGKKVKVEETTYEYEYESPVTYWMQFNGGIGLHDAAGWRSSYGGSIYYYSGSHGCVNLPLSFAKTLYENFDVDTPVIVYFWDNANRK